MSTTNTQPQWLAFDPANPPQGLYWWWCPSFKEPVLGEIYHQRGLGYVITRPDRASLIVDHGNLQYSQAIIPPPTPPQQ